MLQHGAYTLLMDAIYDREKFPTLDDAIDWVWASSQDEVDAITFVLTKFFTLDNDIYIQTRMQQELQEYTGICITNSINGKKGGRPKGSKNKAKKTESVNLESESFKLESEINPSESESKPNHKPLTTNHKPIKEVSPTATDKNTIPVQKIVDIYHEECKSMVRMDILSPERIGAIKSFWNFKAEHKDLDFIRSYFQYAESCSFLNGSVPPSNGYRQLRPDIKWLMNINNYAKIREGKYE